MGNGIVIGHAKGERAGDGRGSGMVMGQARGSGQEKVGSMEYIVMGQGRVEWAGGGEMR